MSKLIVALPWEARLDGDTWTIGQPAIVGGNMSVWYEVARITVPSDTAEVTARMLVRAVNGLREDPEEACGETPDLAQAAQESKR